MDCKKCKEYNKYRDEVLLEAVNVIINFANSFAVEADFDKLNSIKQELEVKET